MYPSSGQEEEPERQHGHEHVDRRQAADEAKEKVRSVHIFRQPLCEYAVNICAFWDEGTETNLEFGGISPAEQEEEPRVHRHAKTSSDSPDGHRPKGEVVDSERGAPLHEAYHRGVDCSKAQELR